MCRVVFLCVLIIACVSGRLIKGPNNDQGFKTKDLSDIGIESNEVKVPPVFAGSDAKCAQIGEFCTYHSDCCSYSCLGYMKRCVSGSG
ncbi:unnamed protein product [Colias eurytheme]|nr:unnamed protein product [Colias eurytheme]